MKTEQEIVRIVDLDRVWVSVQVPEAAAARLAELKSVEVDVPGESVPVTLPGMRGRIVRQGFQVDPETRRIPVILEVNNPNRLLRLGQVVNARLILGVVQPRLAVPGTALVEDGGQTVVYVHETGEGFSRRPVQAGLAGGGYTSILQGLAPGDRVVSRGAYAIRLASLSSQVPAHGHVH